MTAAFVVLWKGAIVAERYGPGIGPQTPLESWSMGKSLAATLIGILIGRGVYDLDQPAPIAEWRAPGDPRGAIRIRDLLNMASGLRSRAPLDPDFDPEGPYPDHLYLYTGGIDSGRWAAGRPPQWPPGKVGRYRNTDPVLVSRLIRQATGSEYFAFPWRALFDPLATHSFTLDADPTGTFLLQGYEQASARDWARLGQLHLQMGRWRGEPILPEAFCRFCRTLAPAWTADANPVYGGFFWVNGDGALPAPADAFFMAGAGGQRCLIVPSHDLVVVRLGHFAGSEAGLAGFARAVGLLMQAAPRSD
jgi:CubicO group peptidase (beta-lactamase class C family)